MSEIKRYNVGWITGKSDREDEIGLNEHENGICVLYSDVEKLEAEVIRKDEKIANLEHANINYESLVSTLKADLKAAQEEIETFKKEMFNIRHCSSCNHDTPNFFWLFNKCPVCLKESKK